APTVTGVEIALPGAPTPTSHLDKAFSGTLTGSKGEPIQYLLTTSKVPSGRLVLYQHGLQADKSSMYALADTLAQAGFAAAAIDLPYYGSRAVTGTVFLDLSNLGAVRENVLEAAADLVQLRKAATTGTGLAGNVFASSVDLVGVSLGGY